MKYPNPSEPYDPPASHRDWVPPAQAEFVQLDGVDEELARRERQRREDQAGQRRRYNPYHFRK